MLPNRTKLRSHREYRTTLAVLFTRASPAWKSGRATHKTNKEKGKGKKQILIGLREKEDIGEQSVKLDDS
jgi:hypothetical protein